MSTLSLAQAITTRAVGKGPVAVDFARSKGRVPLEGNAQRWQEPFRAMSRLAQLNSCARDSLKLRPMPACIGDISEVVHRVAFESDSD